MSDKGLPTRDIHIGTEKGVTACGRAIEAVSPRAMTDRWNEATCESCLRTTLPFQELVLGLSFRNLADMPMRLRKSGLRFMWDTAYAADDGNTLTQICAIGPTMLGEGETVGPTPKPETPDNC